MIAAAVLIFACSLNAGIFAVYGSPWNLAAAVATGLVYFYPVVR